MKNLWYKIKAWFMRVMRNAYGNDDLNRAIMYLTLGLNILSIFLRSPIISFITFGLLFIYMYRFFSKNHVARIEENRKFRKIINYIKLSWKNRKTHKIFICKNCGQFIRVPKGQGNIVTTCPNCKNKEEHHT